MTKINDNEGYFFWKNGKLRFVQDDKEYKVNKEQISRFIHCVDSNPKKWKKGKINSQIIDTFEFHFYYNKYEDNPMDNLVAITKIRKGK